MYPTILLADFDRTLTYMYRDTSLLEKLSNMMIDFYCQHVDIPKNFDFGVCDGYLVWHKLHELMEQNSNFWIAQRVNALAESMVSDFEIKQIKKVELFEGVPKAVKTLHSAGIRLGIASSGATATVIYALEKYCLRGCFEYIQGRHLPFNPKEIKPNPYPIKKAINSFATKNDIIWYVGDDIIDVEAAILADVMAAGVCTGRHSKKELYDAGAGFVFPSFACMASKIAL